MQEGAKLWNNRVRFLFPRWIRFLRKSLFFSASEFGEDKVLADLLHHCRDRYYIDIGCWDPYAASDTYLLYQGGWSGLVIDADGRFARSYGRIRPRDKFVAALLTADGREVDFVESNGTSSASASWHKLFPGKHTRRSSARVQDVLAKVLPSGQRVGFLKIDVENLDAEILLAIDLAWLRPFAIMVELHVMWTDEVTNNRVHRHLQALGYRPIYHNRRNVIYVQASDFLQSNPNLQETYSVARQTLAN